MEVPMNSFFYSKLLKEYSDNNPEKFNKDFILSKNDDDLLSEITNVFKSLEVIKEIHIDSVTINRCEEEFGPIKQNNRYYKSPNDTRLLKIHYKVSIDGLDKPIEKDIFMLKLLDNAFYYSDGVRYYPIWQIVDNLSYKTNNGISVKSILMPITMIKNDPVNITSENGNEYNNINNYYALVFSKKVSPLFYIMMNYSLESLDKAGISPFEDFEKFETYQDKSLCSKLSNFIGVDCVFAENPEEIDSEKYEVFRLYGTRNKIGLSYGINKKDINKKEAKVLMGLISGCRLKDKKKFICCTYEQFITPWYWINRIIDVSGFSKSPDLFKRYNKAKAVLTSLSRIIDVQTRKILPIPEKDKQNIYTLIRYLLINYDYLYSLDSQDLKYKRLRLSEYILYPLRVFISRHISRLLNKQINMDANSIAKTFSSLSSMYLVTALITSRCLRTYNSANDYCLFSAYLKSTVKGPQSIGRGMSLQARALHPSYVGKLDLVNSSAGDPGATATLVPFIKVYNNYFDKEQADKALN